MRRDLVRIGSRCSELRVERDLDAVKHLRRRATRFGGIGDATFDVAL
jgi:hypothetical protein